MNKLLFTIIAFLIITVSCFSQTTKVDFVSESSQLKSAVIPAAGNEMPPPVKCSDFSLNVKQHSMVLIYSPTGEALDQFSAEDGENTCFGRNYPNGIYLLRLTTAAYSGSTLLIKE